SNRVSVQVITVVTQTNLYTYHTNYVSQAENGVMLRQSGSIYRAGARQKNIVSRTSRQLSRPPRFC
ncbi:MAG: hypothetical protein ACREO5_14910, partial [Candidatus Binatia bacterium]